MKIVLVIAAVLLVFNCLNLAIVFTPAMAAADAKTQFNQGLKTTGEKIGYDKIGWSQKSLPEAIGLVIRVILSFLGIIFLVLMIHGGYIWMLARGNEQEVTRAKNIIVNAIIGLVIVLSAYSITWVLSKYLAEKTVNIPELSP
jgi:hypothetical protein